MRSRSLLSVALHFSKRRNEHPAPMAGRAENANAVGRPAAVHHATLHKSVDVRASVLHHVTPCSRSSRAPCGSAILSQRGAVRAQKDASSCRRPPGP